jgi:hypothetical protein
LSLNNLSCKSEADAFQRHSQMDSDRTQVNAVDGQRTLGRLGNQRGSSLDSSERASTTLNLLDLLVHGAHLERCSRRQKNEPSWNPHRSYFCVRVPTANRAPIAWGGHAFQLRRPSSMGLG